MKKSVVWGVPKINTVARAPGTYGSFKEFAKVQDARAAEQKEAAEYLNKAYPLMEALFRLKIENKEPFFIRRALRYQTADLEKSEGGRAKFIDTIKTILPGTQIVLKSLDMSLQEFVFGDALGNEHAINFVDAKNIMMQSDIMESVRDFLNGKK